MDTYIHTYVYTYIHILYAYTGQGVGHTQAEAIVDRARNILYELLVYEALSYELLVYEVLRY